MVSSEHGENYPPWNKDIPWKGPIQRLSSWAMLNLRGCMLFKMGTFFYPQRLGGSKNKTHLGTWLSIVFSLDEGKSMDKLRWELNNMIVPVQAVGTSTFKSSQWAISQIQMITALLSNQLVAGLIRWFRNPANQLRLVVYPVIYRVLYMSGGLPDFFNQQYWIVLIKLPSTLVEHNQNKIMCNQFQACLQLTVVNP